MSKARKMVQEDVQRDEVAEGIYEGLHKVQENRNRIIVALLVILGVALISMAWRSHATRQAVDSTQMLTTSVEHYRAMLDGTDQAAREKALKELLTSADSLASEFPSTKAGREALYLKGAGYYAVDQFDKAIEAYNQYLNKAENDEERARGAIALGYTYENKSFLSPEKDRPALTKSAMDNFDRAAVYAQKDQPYLHAYAQLGQARLLELTGQNDKALALYEQVMKRETPAPAEAKAEKGEEEGKDMLMDLLRRQMSEGEAQMSFQATARLRAERLKASMAPATPAATTTATQAAPTTATTAKP